jgi:signal transduction histidine kinase/CheY-like chemotaxis protein
LVLSNFGSQIGEEAKSHEFVGPSLQHNFGVRRITRPVVKSKQTEPVLNLVVVEQVQTPKGMDRQHAAAADSIYANIESCSCSSRRNTDTKNSNLSQPTSLFDIVMKDKERKPESMELAAAKAEIVELKAALEKERTEKKILEEKVNSFAQSIQEDESDCQDAVIEQNVPLHKEFPSTESESTVQHSAEIPTQQEDPRAAASFSVRDSVEEIQRWLFMEGGHMKDVEEMITEYCVHVRKLGIPLDRLFIGGLMLHVEVSAFVWKWEVGAPFNGHEIPREVFEERKKLFSPDEPFLILHEGRASSVRMRSTDEQIPRDCQWFTKEGYQDYLALPILYQGGFVGGMAWSTKNADGFCEKEIEFFEKSLAALTTVLRLHTNDLVKKTLMGRLEADTRELADANQSLEKANKRVLKQSAAQLKHFAMMSHEIRTPLNCIIGISSLLLDTDMDPAQQDYLRMINSSGDLLCSVVNDVLDYSRLESGNVEINLQRTNLKETMDTVVKAIEIKGGERNLVLRTLLDDRLPLFIETDGNRLQQILYNLLGNAIKFSKDSGTIDVSVLICEEKASTCEKRLRFVVRDYGKGIEKKDIEKIFLPFDQGSSDTERLYGGTGLGLAITMKLVKVLGGNITVDSKPGEWCEFMVDLPYVEPLSQNTEPTNLSIPHDMMLPKIATQLLPSTPSARSVSGSTAVTSHLPSSLNTKKRSLSKVQYRDESLLPCCKQKTDSSYRNIRVLVAEDNKINQKVMKRMLLRLGLECIDIVENGQEAVDREATNTYDVILMDIQMPVMDGFEATRQIVARPRVQLTDIAPKIFFVSAHALDTFQAQARVAGGDGFISKPFKLQKIESIFSRLW